MQKLKILEVRPYGFTTDSEEKVTERQEEIKNQIRRRRKPQNPNFLELLSQSTVSLNEPVRQPHKKLSGSYFLRHFNLTLMYFPKFNNLDLGNHTSLTKGFYRSSRKDYTHFNRKT